MTYALPNLRESNPLGKLSIRWPKRELNVIWVIATTNKE